MANDGGGDINIDPRNSEDAGENKDGDVVPGFGSLDDYLKAGFQAVLKATKLSNALPSGHKWDYYTSFPDIQQSIDIEGNGVLNVVSHILKEQGIRGKIEKRDLEEKFDLILDTNDTVLERVGSWLDEAAGIKKNPEPILIEASGSAGKVISGSWNKAKFTGLGSSPLPNSGPGTTIRLLAAKNVQRPQLKFRDKIDNRQLPFEPKIKEKPNALKQLSLTLEEFEEGEAFSHPYQYELDRFTPPASQLEKCEPKQPRPFAETPVVMVDSTEKLDAMVADLAKQKEIAVDLEHHSYRTYQGFTCLVQISTRRTDYVIDTLELRDRIFKLNEVFTKPSIVKVFHGADHDVVWLQRDFGVYIVNMFDTHQAAKILNFAHLSLAFLLKHYCNVNANKQFQLADWRIRPIPEEMLKYAREDTHYLLYIYDCMKNELLQKGNKAKNLLKLNVQKSKEICEKRYEKLLLTEEKHLLLYKKGKKMFTNRQLYALREIYKWRDKTAREEDESIGYVLPNHMLLQISEVLPREMQGILACCNPIPPLVRQNLNQLHQIILRAREQPLVKVDMETTITRTNPELAMKANMDSVLQCPHDLSRHRDFRDDLPTLVSGKSKDSPKKRLQNALLPSLKSSGIIAKQQPNLSIFADSDEEEDDAVTESTSSSRFADVKFVSPYERYLLVKPFLESLADDSVLEDASDQDRLNAIKAHFLSMTKQEEEEKEKEAAASSSPTPQEPLEDTTPTIPQPVFDETLVVPMRKQSPRKRKRKASFTVTVPDQNLAVETDGTTPLAPKKTKKQNLAVETEGTTPPAPKKTKKKKNFVGKKKKKTAETQPENATFEPYDYNRADFSKFKGGNKKADKGFTPKLKENVKGKGKKNKFTRKGQKSMTYTKKGSKTKT